MCIDLYTIDWVTISALITAIMAIIAFIALYQNRLQLKELKHQWDEKNRARLNFSIVARQDMFLLKITNVGQETAYDINLLFSNNFINNHFIEQEKDRFRKIQQQSFCIESGESNYLFISPIYKSGDYICNKEFHTEEEIKKWLDANVSKPIEITGKYCNKYKVTESLRIEDYIIGSMVIDDELANAVKGIKRKLIVENNLHYPIQKSLDIIAKHYEKK